MLRLVSFTNTVAKFTKELDKTNLFVKLKCRTVSWNVIILNNINHNIVNSKPYAMLDLRFLDSTRNCKVKYD